MDSGLASVAPGASVPAWLCPVGADAQTLLQKYSQVATQCHWDEDQEGDARDDDDIQIYCVECSMVCYGMVWYGMVWYGMVWYGMVWYGIAQPSLAQPV